MGGSVGPEVRFGLLVEKPSYLLTPWSRVLKKLTGFQLVKKCPAFSYFKRENNKNMFTRKVVFELGVLNR